MSLKTLSAQRPAAIRSNPVQSNPASGLLVATLWLAIFSSLLPTRLPAQTEAPEEGTVDVEFADWGFDDRVVPQSFNLLSVGIRNATAKPFDGIVRLRRLVQATGSWTGAEHVEPIYVSPFSQKVVQFFPYILDSSDEWQISWGETLAETYVTERPAMSTGARVILNDPAVISGLTLGLKGFREDRFPATLTGTHSLLCAVVDHSPQWDRERRRVFREWLYRGGVLHVLQDADGRFPELVVPELNQEPRPANFGAGRIYWHPITRGELDRTYIYGRIYSTSRPFSDVVSNGGISLDVDPTTTEYYKEGNRYFESYTDWDTESRITSILRDLVVPEHDWVLLYSLSAAYLLLLFPCGHLLARRISDYRISLLALLGVVVAFTWTFHALGARGYGETTSTYSVALATPLPDDNWDVEQFSSVFVTTGANYGITHAGQTPVYSTAQNLERVPGIIENSHPGRILIDMPQFTSRTLLHRTQLPVERFHIERVQLDLPPPPATAEDEPSEAGTVSVQTDRLPDSPIIGGWLLLGHEMFQLDLGESNVADRSLVFNKREPLQTTLLVDASRWYRRTGVRSQDEALERVARWMIVRSLGLRRRSDADNYTMPNGQVRLFLMTDLSEDFYSRSAAEPDQALGRQMGRVVYQIDGSTGFTGQTTAHHRSDRLLD